MYKSFILFLLAASLYSTNLKAQKPSGELTNYGDNEWYLYTHDQQRLYMFEKGKGKDTVLVLHGGFGAEHSYLIGALEGLYSEYHFIFFDQRGSLRSPCPDSVISVANMIEDIETIRLKTGQQQLVILGHSMGAWMAGMYLEKYPQKVKKLVLVAMPFLVNTGKPEEIMAQRTSDSLFLVFMDRPSVAEVKKTLDTALTDKISSQQWRIDFAKANIFNVHKWKQLQGGMSFYNSRTGSLAGKSMPATWDFTKVYKQVSCPITIINGDHDFSDMHALRYPQLLSGINHVKLVILKNAGHNAWIDQPVLFYKEIKKALN